jgi:hypothetical protein
MSIRDTIKSLVTFSPPEFKQATFTTGTYSGIGPGDVFGPLGQRNADWSDIPSASAPPPTPAPPCLPTPSLSLRCAFTAPSTATSRKCPITGCGR